ncbi:hypothetical protein AC1031_015287 [Aphanomyces cochlioides]|nr:hypothetical protein AC1031_015287 [Aphanomyces cochlioides]
MGPRWVQCVGFGLFLVAFIIQAAEDTRVFAAQVKKAELRVKDQRNNSAQVVASLTNDTIGVAAIQSASPVHSTDPVKEAPATAKPYDVLWCTDVGLGFELDFVSAYTDVRGFAHYFNDRMKTELQDRYSVYFRDVSPSETAQDKAFIVFTICEPRDDTAISAPWLMAVQAALRRVALHAKALQVSGDQSSKLTELSAYVVKKGQHPANLEVTPIESSIALVPPDSNGLPQLNVSFRVKNAGQVPLRIFQVVCHNIDGFRDVVLPLATRFVLGSGVETTLSLDGYVVQTDNDKRTSSAMQVHIVQSSGEFREIEVDASIQKPPIQTTVIEETQEHEDEDLGFVQVITDGDEWSMPLEKENRLPKDEFKPNLDIPKENPWPKNEFKHSQDTPTENRLPKKFEERVMQTAPLRMKEEDNIHPISTFPASSWKALSVLLLVGVVGYTSFFVYSKVKNRSIAWSKLQTKRRATREDRVPTFDDDYDDDDNDENAKECEMMLRRPMSPPAQVEKPDPIQLNHPWGPPKAGRLQPQPMKPVIQSPKKAAPAATPPATRAPLPAQVPPRLPYQLQLDPTMRLHPKRFESLWEECIELKSWKRSAVTDEGRGLPGSAVIIAVFESQGVQCMASGSLQLVDKYLLYTYEVALGQYLFVELVVDTVSMQVSTSVRGHRDVRGDVVDALATLSDALLTAMLTTIQSS